MGGIVNWTLGEFTNHKMFHIEEYVNKIGEWFMTAQASVDNAVNVFGALLEDLKTVASDLKTQLANMGVAVDTTALDALVANVPAVQGALDALDTSKTGTGTTDDGTVPADSDESGTDANTEDGTPAPEVVSGS